MSEPPPRKASFSRMTIVIAFLIAMVSAGCLVTFAFGVDAKASRRAKPIRPPRRPPSRHWPDDQSIQPGTSARS
jgi:hypothetical protein